MTKNQKLQVGGYCFDGWLNLMSDFHFLVLVVSKAREVLVEDNCFEGFAHFLWCHNLPTAATPCPSPHSSTNCFTFQFRLFTINFHFSVSTFTCQYHFSMSQISSCYHRFVWVNSLFSMHNYSAPWAFKLHCWCFQIWINLIESLEIVTTFPSFTIISFCWTGYYFR